MRYVYLPLTDLDNLTEVNVEAGIYQTRGDINMLLHKFQPGFISNDGFKLEAEGVYADLGVHGYVAPTYCGHMLDESYIF